jgi:cold shock protein
MRTTELRHRIKIVVSSSDFAKDGFAVQACRTQPKGFQEDPDNTDDVGAITHVRCLLIQCRVRAVAEPVLRATPPFFLKDLSRMPQGTIKRKTDKGFGFIDTGTGKDMFFHSSNVEGSAYEQLHEGQKVSYNEGRGPKGPRAENVRPI